MARFPHAFISHSDHDHDFAIQLKRELEEYGLPIWFDLVQLRAGDSLSPKIPDAIRKNDFLLVLLSPKSVKSSWVKAEIDTALDDELRKNKVKLIPVLLPGCNLCEIPDVLKDEQTGEIGRYYADFRKNFCEGISVLLRGMCRDQEVFLLRLDRVPLQVEQEGLVAILRYLIDRVTQEELNRVLRGVTDFVARPKWLAVLDDGGLTSELEEIWQQSEQYIKETFGHDVVISYRNSLTAFRFAHKNLALLLPKYINTALAYLGKHVETPSEILRAVQDLVKIVMYWLGRRVIPYCRQDLIRGMRSIDGEAFKDNISTIDSRFETQVVPSRSIEVDIFDCDFDDLLYLGFKGKKDAGKLIRDVSVDVPCKALDRSALKFLYAGVHPLEPITEIFHYNWVRYFLPVIAARHLLDFSYEMETIVRYRKRATVKRLIDCIGLELGDYDHYGLN